MQAFEGQSFLCSRWIADFVITEQKVPSGASYQHGDIGTFFLIYAFV